MGLFGDIWDGVKGAVKGGVSIVKTGLNDVQGLLKGAGHAAEEGVGAVTGALGGLGSFLKPGNLLLIVGLGIVAIIVINKTINSPGAAQIIERVPIR